MPPRNPSLTPARLALGLAQAVALIVPAAALAGAYAFQIWGGLYPCEMCWWQRYAHAAALGLALAALLAPRGGSGQRLWLRLSALALLAAAAIGLYHAGVENGLWRGFTACTSMVRFASGQDALSAIMAAPLLRCDDAQWRLFGVSLAGFDFVLSGAGALLVLGALARARREVRR